MGQGQQGYADFQLVLTLPHNDKYQPRGILRRLDALGMHSLSLAIYVKSSDIIQNSILGVQFLNLFLIISTRTSQLLGR